MNNSFVYGVELDDLASQEIFYSMRDYPNNVNLEKNVKLGLFTKDSHLYISPTDQVLGSHHLFGVQFDFNKADLSSQDVPKKAKDLFDIFALPILNHFGEKNQPSISKMVEHLKV